MNIKAIGTGFMRGFKNVKSSGLSHAWESGGTFKEGLKESAASIPSGIKKASGLLRNPTGARELLKGRAVGAVGIIGANVVARGISSLMTRTNTPIPPGAMATSGKRGIDSNNLNSSGIGLSMYRNRRR